MGIKDLHLEDLHKKLTTFLAKDVPAYSVKHLKRRLLPYFKDTITVTERPGSANILTFKDIAANILHESYQTQMEDNEDSEIKIKVNQMGKMIGTIIIIKEQATAD